MKIQLLSDLHLEFFSPTMQYLGEPNISSEVDVIVLTGDIHNGKNAIDFSEKIADKYKKPVIFVPGNHEYYHQDIKETIDIYRKGAKGVHVLLGVNFKDIKEEELYIDIDGVRFCGGTFWTDFNLYKDSVRMPLQRTAMRVGGNSINDFRIIKNGHQLFTPEDSVNYFNECLELVNKVLDKPFSGKKVLVSHHGLHKKSVHQMYTPEERQLNSPHALVGENTGWMINPAFISHHPQLLEKVDIHLHGHTHSSLEYQVGNCRVYTNPRGYPIKSTNGIKYENPNYQPMFIIEV